jgi:hypothetical protein
MDTVERLGQLRTQRDGLLKKLEGIRDFRPGSLGPRFRKCGKPGCHCAHDGSKGHGPTWMLTRKIEGKTVTKVIPVSAVTQTQQQLVDYRLFHDTVGELIETNVLICDTLLELPGGSEAAAPDTAAAEKGGSQRPSRKRS